MLLILLAGVAAGALNAVGGGGSFVAVYLTAAVIFACAAGLFFVRAFR